MKTKPRWFWYQVGGISLALFPSLVCLWFLSNVSAEAETADNPFIYLAITLSFMVPGYVLARVGEKQEDEDRIMRLVDKAVKEHINASS